MSGAPEMPADIAQTCRAGGERLIFVVSGRRGAGKTTWCLALADEVRRQGLTVAGLASPAVFRDGRKTAIDLRELAGGETRRLAERRSPGMPGTADLGWRFDSATLAWGNRILATLERSDLLVIDELGPLEFQHHQGLTNAFAAIDAEYHRLAAVVIRPELIGAARRRWPQARVLNIAGDGVASAHIGMEV